MKARITAALVHAAANKALCVFIMGDGHFDGLSFAVFVLFFLGVSVGLRVTGGRTSWARIRSSQCAQHGPA